MNDDRRLQLRPYSPPTWTAPLMRINNLLLNKSHPISFELGDNRLFRLQLLPHQTQETPNLPIGITLGLGESTAALWLSEWPLLDHIRTFIPEGMLTRLPENLGIALAENALDPLINAIENSLASKVKIQSLSAEQNSRLYNLPISFELLEAQKDRPDMQHTRSIRGLLMLEERLYPLLQERLRSWPSDLNEDWENLEAIAYLEIGNATVSVQEVNSFTESDIILLDNHHFPEEGILTLRFSNLLSCGAQLSTEPTRTLTITTGWNNMADNEPKQSINQINQIPVQLSFDLGQKTLSFNEVKQLRPGYVIDLTQGLPEVVQIRAQNKLIGTGELVDISGRIGVRILSLFGSRNKGG